VSASELALSFGRAAAAYERGRPEWLDEGIDHAIDQLGLAAGATVLDLAAGTGKLARKLVPRFHRVIAVEPDDAMRVLLEAIVPEAEALRGTAQEIPLRAGDVDAVFIGEALHWFAGADEFDESGAWKEAFSASSFEPLRHAHFEHVQRVSRDGVLAYFASISPIASLPDEEQRERLERVSAQLDRDTYERHWGTDVYWTRLAA